MMSPKDVKKRTPSDYVFGKLIGEGSFSSVYLAKDIHTNKEYAIKVCEKKHILREKKGEYIMREKEVFIIIGTACPYFVHLSQTMQDSERLYFVLTYAKNGELLQQINKHGCFNTECTRYYTAQLVLALEFLHSKGIIHRDLKPENILLDENWNLRVTDFGSAKILGDETKTQQASTQRRRSFVGTAQFISPEVLTDKLCTFSSDLWALGCIVYQMVSGDMPFRGPSEFLIFQNIMKLKYEFPDAFDATAKDLVEKLLVLDASNRLGANDEDKRYESIRRHDLFIGINWDALGPPPKLSDYNETVDYTIPEHLEPGLDRDKVPKLYLDYLEPQPVIRKKSEPGSKLADLTDEIISQRLESQKDNAYNSFVEGNLIIKQGLIDKKKGLFPRRRMFLLTLGPHLYYVDPVTMIKKGEVPFSSDMRTEAKNFRIFYIHTPNRKYNLEDPDGYAMEWCKAVEEMKAFYYPESTSQQE